MLSRIPHIIISMEPQNHDDAHLFLSASSSKDFFRVWHECGGDRPKPRGQDRYLYLQNKPVLRLMKKAHPWPWGPGHCHFTWGLPANAMPLLADGSCTLWALCTSGVTHLQHWPLTRDTFFFLPKSINSHFYLFIYFSSDINQLLSDSSTSNFYLCGDHSLVGTLPLCSLNSLESPTVSGQVHRQNNLLSPVLFAPQITILLSVVFLLSSCPLPSPCLIFLSWWSTYNKQLLGLRTCCCSWSGRDIPSLNVSRQFS